jgi:hypothetical protein
MPKVRAKFICDSIKSFDHKNMEVELSAVTRNTSVEDEDKGFWQYTPSGEIKMQINNPKASKNFVPGKTCYVDFVFE